MLARYNRPVFFYSLSMIIPWIFWGVAAYLSHRPDAESYTRVMSVLTLVGVLVPAGIAGYLFRADRELYQDLKNRLSFKGIKGQYLFLTLFLTSIALLLGQLLSVLLGHSLDQFQIVGSPSFHLGIFSGWFILVFASVVEELAC